MEDFMFRHMYILLLPLIIVFFPISCYSMRGHLFIEAIEKNILDSREISQNLSRIIQDKKADADLALRYISLYGPDSINTKNRSNLLGALNEQDKNIIISAVRRVALANYNYAKRSLFETEKLKEASRLFHLLEEDCPRRTNEPDITGSYFELTKKELKNRENFVFHQQTKKIEGPLFVE